MPVRRRAHGRRHPVHVAKVRARPTRQKELDHPGAAGKGGVHESGLARRVQVVDPEAAVEEEGGGVGLVVVGGLHQRGEAVDAAVCVVWCDVGWGCGCGQVDAWGFVVGRGFAEVPSNTAVFVVGRTPAQVREGGEDV